MDTTVGVVLNWAFLSGVASLAKYFGWSALVTTGDYGDPIRVR